MKKGDVLKGNEIQLVVDAVKAAKWQRSNYEYALNNLMPWHYWCQYKLPELKEIFKEQIKTKFYLIADFTTFKSLNF